MAYSDNYTSDNNGSILFFSISFIIDCLPSDILHTLCAKMSASVYKLDLPYWPKNSLRELHMEKGLKKEQILWDLQRSFCQTGLEKRLKGLRAPDQMLRWSLIESVADKAH